MFKKIEIWILYLFAFLTIPLVISFGFLVRQELEGSTKFGLISKSALFLAEMPVNIKRIILEKNNIAMQTQELRFGSLSGFDGIPNIQESYLLLSKFDGNLEKGIIELIDLRNFKVLHTWSPNINKFNRKVKNIDEFEYLNRDNNNFRQILYHPKLINDGGLLFNSSPLRKIDRCSNLIFQNDHDIFHHSIETDIEGNIWVPSRMYPQSLPSKKVGRKIDGFIDDAIVKLNPNGEILFEKSVSEIFIENGLEYLLFSTGGYKFKDDPIHLNDIQPVNYKSDYWKKGDVFLSLRNQSMVLLYRPSTNKIIWKGTGPFFYQHDIDILDNNKISIFNNNTKNFIDGDFVDGNNEMIIYDFKKDSYSKYLADSLVKNDVRTITNGRGTILSNGELFIEETNYGRILFIESNGNLRWTYVNRADNDKNYIIGWSRILFKTEDIQIVNNFLDSKGFCDD